MPTSARRAMAAALAAPQTAGMLTRKRLGEALITATLWSIYLGSRGSVLAIVAAESVLKPLP